jgi:ribosomal protein L11 methyltransferase
MWREFSFVTGREEVERWSDALLEAGALSVQAEDADAETTDEQALFGEPGMPAPAAPGWNRTRLTALLPADADFHGVLSHAAELLEAPPPGDLVTRVFGDEDWVRRSQAQFEPILIGNDCGSRRRGDGSLRTPSRSRRHRSFPGTGSRSSSTPDWHSAPGAIPPRDCCLRWLEQHLRPRGAGHRLWLRIGHPGDRGGTARRIVRHRRGHRSAGPSEQP